MLALAFGLTRFGFSAVAAVQQSPAAQETTQPQQPNMQAMMKMHEQMMAEMKSGDAKLDALVKDMNSATGQTKVTAIAAAVNELVLQHKTMHGRMGQMHQQIMGGRGRMMGR
jgi:conjugal transfer/entry exclusion protein